MFCSVAQPTATENSFSMVRVLSLFSPLGVMVSKLSLILSEADGYLDLLGLCQGTF
jgi:hypothetical protein